MGADTYYMLWCIGLLALTAVIAPAAYWLGKRNERGLADSRCNARIDMEIRAALARQRDAINRGWRQISNASITQDEREAETRVMEATK